FNATPDEVPVLAIRGNVEDTGNADLATRVLVPIENTIPEPARYTLYHQGKGQMLDHMLVPTPPAPGRPTPRPPQSSYLTRGGPVPPFCVGHGYVRYVCYLLY